MALKKCPFCGGTPDLKDFGDGEGGWMISCICGCIMTAYAEHPEMENWPTIHKQIKKNVIRNWERRYPIWKRGVLRWK